MASAARPASVACGGLSSYLVEGRIRFVGEVVRANLWIGLAVS